MHEWRNNHEYVAVGFTKYLCHFRLTVQSKILLPYEIVPLHFG